MTVTVVDTWPHQCEICESALYLRRSIAAGGCCCCRGDHAPDTDVRDEMTSATSWAVVA